MKRKLLMGIWIICAFLLQSTIFGKLSFAGIRPNLLLILVSSFGFMRGRRSGMAVGFLCGLLMDVFWGGLLGFYTLIMTLIGYMNGSFQRLYYEDDIRMPLALVAASDLLYTIASFVCLFMLRGKFIFGYFLYHIILPELVYTVILTLILYRFILRFNQLLETEEQRSASKFV